MKYKPPKGLDGEHLFAELVRAMKRAPQYLSGDDDLSTTGGVLATAVAFIDRLLDDK